MMAVWSLWTPRTTSKTMTTTTKTTKTTTMMTTSTTSTKTPRKRRKSTSEHASAERVGGLVDDLAEKDQRLREVLASFSSAVVAFSGGVDSAYLAVVASQVLGS